MGIRNMFTEKEYDVTLVIRVRTKYRVKAFGAPSASKEALRLAALDYDIDPDGRIKLDVSKVERSS